MVISQSVTASRGLTWCHFALQDILTAHALLWPDVIKHFFNVKFVTECYVITTTAEKLPVHLQVSICFNLKMGGKGKMCFALWYTTNYKSKSTNMEKEMFIYLQYVWHRLVVHEYAILQMSNTIVMILYLPYSSLMPVIASCENELSCL